MNDRVTIAIADQIADVRLARPDKMNAIDPAMFEGIGAAIDSLAGRTDVRCVVLSGEGRGFCAGLDMTSMQGGPVVAGPQRSGRDPAAARGMGLAQSADAGDRGNPWRCVRRRISDHVGRRYPHRRADRALRDPRDALGPRPRHGWLSPVA
jgi:enoyl-CoA hydratase/carnithine racemase